MTTTFRAWCVRLVFVTFLTCGVRRASAIVGDQVPPPYPIMDIHVPEPKVGSLQKKWAADENQQGALKLEEAGHRLAAASDAFWASTAPLGAKIENAAALAEEAVNLLS